MKIGLIDADLIDGGTRHPNLAIMKLAGYFIELGNDVDLILDGYNTLELYDEVYISKVFNFTKTGQYTKEDFQKMSNVKIGGTGFFEDGGPQLPDEIEHHMPYYDIYKKFLDINIKSHKDRTKYSDYLDYSIGFTTRGCFRKCAFCVNKKYDHVKKHAPVSEFMDLDRPMIYLWDDNILGYPQWESVIDELVETGKPFHFKQGIDIRLMSEQKAKRFNEVKYHGDFTFAFDHLKDKELIVKNVQLWKMYSSRIPRMYVLSGFDSQDEKDIESVFERIHTLMKYGSLPYIMRYEKYRESKYASLYTQIARWCNQPQFYKKKSFREYCLLNDEYKKTPGHSSAMNALKLFENDFPEIAEKYFDLKFENECYYNTSFGEEQRYINKRPCDYCKSLKLDWDTVSKLSDEEFLALFITKTINFRCMQYKNSQCTLEDKYAAKLANALQNVDEAVLIERLKNENNGSIENITTVAKNLNCTLEEIVALLNNLSDKELRFDIVAKSIFGDVHQSNRNAAKLSAISRIAARSGLVYFNRKNNVRYLSISPLGTLFRKEDEQTQKRWMNKLQFSNPYFLYFLKKEMDLKIEREQLLDMGTLNQKLYREYNKITKEN